MVELPGRALSCRLQLVRITPLCKPSLLWRAARSCGLILGWAVRFRAHFYITGSYAPLPAKRHASARPEECSINVRYGLHRTPFAHSTARLFRLLLLHVLSFLAFNFHVVSLNFLRR